MINWENDLQIIRPYAAALQPCTPVLTPLFYFHGLTSTAVYWMTYTTQSPSLPALSILLLGHVQLAIPKTLSLIRPAIIHSSGLDLANKSHWAFSDFFSLLSSATAAVFLNSVSPSASLTLSRVSTVTISARPPHWTWQPAICMPDHFSSSLGLFLALIPPLPLSLSLYARRIENNSATDGRRHARPCPTRLRIHFICARGEWIKINDGWTFIAFWGWRRDWGGEAQVAEWDLCLILNQTGRQFDSDWHTALVQPMKTRRREQNNPA